LPAVSPGGKTNTRRIKELHGVSRDPYIATHLGAHFRTFSLAADILRGGGLSKKRNSYCAQQITCALETSWQRGSIALFKGNELLGSAFLDGDGRASARMTACVQEFMSVHCLKCSDISRVIVSLGPGSFTGTRSGVAIAEGMAAAGCELVGVPFLFALAQVVDMSAWEVVSENECSSEQGSQFFLVSLPANAAERFAAVYLRGQAEEQKAFSGYRNCNLESTHWIEILKPQAVAQNEVVEIMTRQVGQLDSAMDLPMGPPTLIQLRAEEVLDTIVPAELVGIASQGSGSLVKGSLDGSLIPEYVKRVRAKTILERQGRGGG